MSYLTNDEIVDLVFSLVRDGYEVDEIELQRGLGASLKHGKQERLSDRLEGSTIDRGFYDGNEVASLPFDDGGAA